MSHGKSSSKNSKKSRKLRFKKSLEMINPNVAGVDIAMGEHWCCIPDWDTDEPVRKFGTNSSQLRDIVAWFQEYSIQSVAMESTGIYWIPLYLALIEAGIEVFLVNARSIKNVNGRPKTDKLDCQWIWRLHSYGLLRSSFLPDCETFTLQAYTRHRDNQVKSQSREVQHMQKALFTMNINLDLMLRDIQGQTGMRIIHAIVAGERDPVKLAKLKDCRTKHSEAEIAAALDGQYSNEQLFILKQSLKLYDFYQQLINNIDNEIEQFLRKKVELLKLKDPQRFEDKKTDKKKKPFRVTRQTLGFDIGEMGKDIYRVDTMAMPGFGPSLLLTALAEAGTDLSCWPTPGHFSSWLGLSPCPDISGGKRLNNKTRKVVNRLSHAFRLGARTLERSDSALGAFYHRMKAKKGAPKAMTAAARKMAEIFYIMVVQQKEFIEIGAEYYNKRRKDKTLKYLERKAKIMGFELTKIEESGDELAS